MKDCVDHTIFPMWLTFFVRHHIMQFDWILVSLDFMYKQCQTPDLLISVLYIAAMPKRIRMVHPTIKKILLQ